MVDETLKRLLDAELKAEKLVAKAKAGREEVTRRALEEARQAEARFSARIPEIRDAFLGKTRERAGQTIAELQRRYDERSKDLRELAEQHEKDAVDAALALLLETTEG